MTDVLPVFFYNAAPFRGDDDDGRIGLNLFEPRYRLLCERMQQEGARKAFLWLTAYRDYGARPGDFAYLIKVGTIQSSTVLRRRKRTR